MTGTATRSGAAGIGGETLAPVGSAAAALGTRSTGATAATGDITPPILITAAGLSVPSVSAGAAIEPMVSVVDAPSEATTVFAKLWSGAVTPAADSRVALASAAVVVAIVALSACCLVMGRSAADHFIGTTSLTSANDNTASCAKPCRSEVVPLMASAFAASPADALACISRTGDASTLPIGLATTG